MSARDATTEIPVFSQRLDEVLGMMIKGDAPNAGRFCANCYTPLGKKAEVCPHCATQTSERAPLAKVPPEVIAMYRRMRTRESLVVNSFAFAGLFLGVLVFMGLVAVAVYRMDGSWVMLSFATVVLLVGGRIFAGVLGGWIGDDIGYNFAHKKLALEWVEFEHTRDDSPPPEAAHAQPAPATSPQ
ncbi:MAG: zinc ribbon domain-containing protein [Chloroflexi bacterium]|nr:zinc ribbon domain-containing protein [Chloroflexota bacterium]